MREGTEIGAIGNNTVWLDGLDAGPTSSAIMRIFGRYGISAMLGRCVPAAGGVTQLAPVSRPDDTCGQNQIIWGKQIMRPNRLRQKLDAGEPTIGTHILSSWPTLVELIGDAENYDYVEFTAEYAPFTMHDLDNLGRAFELKNLAGMIKVEQKQYTHQAMRAIGSGFQSVLFADIRTVADAEACVAAVRAETPGTGGRLGVGMRRDVGTVLEGGSPAYVDALNEVVIAIMVEKRECVEDLEAILSVPGIDMVQFGSSDYSMSLGLTGQRSHPDVVKAERRTIETALRMGKHPRVELADIAGAKPYLEMGVRHFCIGWDVRILYNWWRTNGAGMRAMLTGEAAVAPAPQPVKTGTY